MIIYILILVLTPGVSYRSGAATVSQEFIGEQACRQAATAIVTSMEARTQYVATWGCFRKSGATEGKQP